MLGGAGGGGTVGGVPVRATGQNWWRVIAPAGKKVKKTTF